MPTPATSSSSRSTRASRSSTRSPRSSPASTSSRRRSRSPRAAGSATGRAGIPPQDEIRLNGHAMQCRITTEDPENNFIPDYGRITAYRGARGFGIRLDGGTAYPGAVVTPLLRLAAGEDHRLGADAEEAIARMDRALREFRIRGVKTNLAFLENLHRRIPTSAPATTRRGSSTTTPELFRFAERRDRATKLLTYIADVTVNGHPEVKGRARPRCRRRAAGAAARRRPPPDGAAAPKLLDRAGPGGLRATGCASRTRVLITDTTMRDAHQSLLATRMRTYDLLACAEPTRTRCRSCSRSRCWGGATFDVADAVPQRGPVGPARTHPRARCPTSCCRCCCAARTRVGYTNYPDNVVRALRQRRRPRPASTCSASSTASTGSRTCGRDRRRARDRQALRGGHLLHRRHPRPRPGQVRPELLRRRWPRSSRRAGAHILGDQGHGRACCKPAAAQRADQDAAARRSACRSTSTPTTPRASAAATRAGRGRRRRRRGRRGDGRRCRGLTSQPNLGSIVEALRAHRARHRARPRGDPPSVSFYWEAVRAQYCRFESDLRAGASEVYQPRDAGRPVHQPQAAGPRARPGVALARGRQGLRRRQPDVRRHREGHAVLQGRRRPGAVHGRQRPDPAPTCSTPTARSPSPDSVVEMLHGDLGQPPGGLPEGAAEEGAEGPEPITVRPGLAAAPADLDADARAEAEKSCGRELDDRTSSPPT